MVKPAKIKKRNIDNSWVVPYNLFLIKKFSCHINVEICFDIKFVKYIYKYICKEHEKIAFFLRNNDTNIEIDEIKQCQGARWISPSEVAWHFFVFSISDMTSCVSQL
ncbi:hypothetical protein T459_21499 [Capsicum annuum]|uniref:Uncharacterized protein n=1 Tax=Capsicum annuum TaxID=4072 RepID=A0A2G2YWU4_CAPAN|nr:hypothetical protein T459_21499 [Capsicum annuum]